MGRGTNPVGRDTPLPTLIRTYGASVLGFLAPTELDTRAIPFRKSWIRHCLELTRRNTSNYSMSEHDADKRLNFMSKRSVLCFCISLGT